ncbi:MAG: bifunctional hydroxymethylpyrimidine kinase/phosphomethylpyrimidine kinase [Vulcanimicrobiaceae bacterium]
MAALRPLVLSIGTTHPWNIAGVGIDTRVAADFGVRHAVVIAGVTAQDESGLREKFSVPANFVRAQLQSVPIGVAAIRIGAIFSQENIREVSGFLESNGNVPAVIDPVFWPSLGGSFHDDETFEIFCSLLLPQAAILTPNIPEAQRLTAREIDGENEMLSAARALRKMGASAVLLKGGHLSGDPADLLVTNTHEVVYRGERLAGSMRGAGCTLAAAIACELACGSDTIAAVVSARAYVRAKISAKKLYGSLQVAF